VEEELDRLGEKLAWASLAACGVFAGVGLLRGYTLSVVLKDALALAVAAVPEGLPMVATTTMSLGLRKLEKRGILIRKLSAVESIGAIETICLDKTGTLTQNRITVTDAATGAGPVALDDRDALATLAEIAALNNDVALEDGVPQGSAGTEKAILSFALGAGSDAEGLRAARSRTATVERAPGRPWMLTAHEGEGWPVLCKGSPEALIDAASHVLTPDGPRPLDDETRARLAAENDRLASKPARVLGFAVAEAMPEDEKRLPEGLVFAGLLGMQDPLRADAGRFIRRLHRAGIETVLITGDQAGTATAIAEELDLARGGALRIVDSTELAEMNPDLLAGLARDTHVFTRVASHQKLAIVKALQSAGRVVAMTGDGVNDGPALNAADVGIAMGQSGADLARDVANVVIRDDALDTLMEAVAEGRALYRNIRRSLEFLVTTNMSEIGVSIVEAAHGPGELETPMELLWINMVTDVLPGLGLALADPDRDVLERPPRGRGEPIVPRRDMRRMGIDGGLIAASALVAHFAGLARYGPGPETRGMTFLALSQGQLLYTLVSQRTDERHLHPARLLENTKLDAALLLSSGLGALPFFVPGLRRLLGIAPLGGRDLALSLAMAAVPFGTVLARRGITLTLEELEARP
jgi:Ca2+-transporting ATPase